MISSHLNLADARTKARDTQRQDDSKVKDYRLAKLPHCWTDTLAVMLKTLTRVVSLQ